MYICIYIYIYYITDTQAVQRHNIEGCAPADPAPDCESGSETSVSVASTIVLEAPESNIDRVVVPSPHAENKHAAAVMVNPPVAPVPTIAGLRRSMRIIRQQLQRQPISRTHWSISTTMPRRRPRTRGGYGP